MWCAVSLGSRVQIIWCWWVCGMVGPTSETPTHTHLKQNEENSSGERGGGCYLYRFGAAFRSRATFSDPRGWGTLCPCGLHVPLRHSSTEQYVRTATSNMRENKPIGLLDMPVPVRITIHVNHWPLCWNLNHAASKYYAFTIELSSEMYYSVGTLIIFFQGNQTLTCRHIIPSERELVDDSHTTLSWINPPRTHIHDRAGRGRWPGRVCELHQ